MNTIAVRWFVAVTLVFLSAKGSIAGEDPKIFPDVVYGRKDGMAMTLDVIQPAKQNGAAIIWIPTGGWVSPYIDSKLTAKISQPMLEMGYTVIAVRHGCAPRYNIPECTKDVRRAVRFIRMKSKDWGFDADRIGVWGASAGGHLSLVLGTTGDDGDKGAKDEVLKHSSRVTCVAALCPPTDLREWVVTPPEVIRKIPSLKPPLTFDPKLAPEHSPLAKVSATSAPSLLIHGDKDELVPIDHSQKLVAEMEKQKVACKLLTIEGAGHSFSPKQNATLVVPAMMEWFDRHLGKKE